MVFTDETYIDDTPEDDAREIPILLDRLTKDLRKAAHTLGDKEARFLVDQYYTMQEQRIRANQQIKAMGDEPHILITWLAKNFAMLEQATKVSLDTYSANHEAGAWLRSIVGIGPVIAAGLLAHIDIERTETVSQIWRFAGLDPSMRWEKGKKRPWNGQLKTLCWKAGESFVKVCNRENDFYGHIYVTQKAKYVSINDVGGYAEQAARILTEKKFGKDTEAFKQLSQGKLPQAQIHARAKRYAVKLFLSHLHHVWFKIHHGKLPPNPYPIEHMGHAHMIEPPKAA